MNVRMTYLMLLWSVGSIAWGQSDLAGAIENRQSHGMMPDQHSAFLETHCFDCHDQSSSEGGVNLQDLAFKMDSLQTAELWQKVLNAVNSGEMPPEDSEPLPAAAKTEFLADLSTQLVVARNALSDSGGVITMRRLNRREYENTIESLLDVKINVSDLPDDAGSNGFDTTGAGLFFSSDQFEQYLKLAKIAIDRAIVDGDKPKSKTVRTEIETKFRKQIQSQANRLKNSWDRAEAWKNSGGKPPTDFNFIDSARVDFEVGNYHRFHPTFQAYLDHPASKTGVPLYNFFRGCIGPEIALPDNSESRKFVIRARVAVLNDDVPRHRRFIEYGTVSAGADAGEINVHGFHRITGTMDQPQIVEIEFTPIDSGDRTFKIRERRINETDAARSFFRTSQAKTGLGPPPALWIDWVELEGPIIDQWPPASHQRIFIPRREDQKSYSYFRSLLISFATRAFRTKEPSRAFIDKLMGIYSSQVKSGIKPREAIKEPLAIVLASPGFLYLNEPTFGERRRELTDPELAVRLAYFLWSAPPDAELQELANQGRLKDPAILRQQTTRMLSDPAVDDFVSGFAHQWLHMDRLDFFQFNFQKYPRFDDSVKESARLEIYETIKDAIRQHRPVRQLLKSDHVMLNNLLASYYGIDGVEGEHFRRVRVPNNVPRGGLPGMAAIMAMGSDGERSSPVERGAWILRCLLNDPPPPAPPNVPQLSRLDGQPLGARDLQKAHQEEPQCAQCHRKIDPLGFGLENFDAVGLWRETETSSVSNTAGKKNKQVRKRSIPIDASGTMPDGSEFHDFSGLRTRLAERHEDFARGLTENLIEYALGRPYGFTDTKLADQILTRARQKDYAMDEFILGIVESKRFRMK